MNAEELISFAGGFYYARRTWKPAQLEEVIYCRGYRSFLPDYSTSSRLCILDIPVLIPLELWEIEEKWPLSFLIITSKFITS